MPYTLKYILIKPLLNIITTNTTTHQQRNNNKHEVTTTIIKETITGESPMIIKWIITGKPPPQTTQ